MVGVSIATFLDVNQPSPTRSFLGKVEEIAAPAFVPSNQEILRVRDPTRTIETMDFQANKARFRVIDVGGQRMERPKWNLTGEITAVIFVCALTEYNQVLREDVKQNRLKESLNLFDIACNRRYPDKPIILFLNKMDLFKEQIERVDLNVCFPAYKGAIMDTSSPPHTHTHSANLCQRVSLAYSQWRRLAPVAYAGTPPFLTCPAGGKNYKTALEFIRWKFKSIVKDKDKEIYIKETTATDPENMQHILNSVYEIVLRQNLANSGFQ